MQKLSTLEGKSGSDRGILKFVKSGREFESQKAEEGEILKRKRGQDAMVPESLGHKKAKPDEEVTPSHLPELSQVRTMERGNCLAIWYFAMWDTCLCGSFSWYTAKQLTFTGPVYVGHLAMWEQLDGR